MVRRPENNAISCPAFPSKNQKFCHGTVNVDGSFFMIFIIHPCVCRAVISRLVLASFHILQQGVACPNAMQKNCVWCAYDKPNIKAAALYTLLFFHFKAISSLLFRNFAVWI